MHPDHKARVTIVEPIRSIFRDVEQGQLGIRMSMFDGSGTCKDLKPFSIERLAHTNSISHPRYNDATTSNYIAS
jgi:hypothetical protein